MTMQPITTFSLALQRMRAAAHIGMGETWFDKNGNGIVLTRRGFQGYRWE